MAASAVTAHVGVQALVCSHAPYFIIRPSLFRDRYSNRNVVAKSYQRPLPVA